MKALVYNGARDVSVKTMPDAKIERPTDVLVRVTTTNICGSDLHMYEGRTDMESGRILGHENLGIPEDSGAEDALAKKGQLAFDFGKFWFKGQKIGTGQANVKAYNRKLCNLIHADKANPSLIVSHELPLEKAPEAYKHFDQRDQGWTKVILKPGK